MLVLTRKVGEEIVIDGGIRVTISSIKGPARMKAFQDKMSLVMQPKA